MALISGRVTKPYSTDPLALFDKINELGGLYSTDRQGGFGFGSGSIGRKNARVEFHFGALARWPDALVPVTLHEITHVAPDGNYFGCVATITREL
jgi:hypothetical protein